MSSSNKVAINTLILYARMLITMGISLYSTRLILNALGAVDYGVFNLIAGLIAMLSFLNTAMATSTQRYLSFHQGKEDVLMQKKIFRNSFLIHIVIGSIVVICLEITGIFLFDGFLNIPLNRQEIAKTVFHFMTLTVFFNVVSVPFTGTLVAHENMLWVAIVNIIETLLKLAIAVLLVYISSDKLIVYGILTAVSSIISFFLYGYYCFRKYEECTLKDLGTTDKKMIRELTSFAGWNLFGSICALGSGQGLAVLLNLFLGTVINASYAIANQVASQLNFFSATLLRAINPQIMKSEGAGDRERMLRLSMMASKFGFFLLAIVAIPCIFEMSSILKFWLKNVPQYTVIFCQLILIGTLTNQLTIGLQSAIQATGKIKAYQSIIGTVILLNIPISYFLLKFGYPPYAVLISFIMIEMIACSLRLYLLKLIAGLSITQYFKRVFLKEILPLGLAIGSCLVITNYVFLDIRFLLTGIVSSSMFILGIIINGLCNDEKELLSNKIRLISMKVKNRSAVTIK